MKSGLTASWGLAGLPLALLVVLFGRGYSMRSWLTRAFADRLYVTLLACLLLIQALTSAVDWYDFTFLATHEGNPTWALGSPLLSVSLRLLAAILLLTPVLLILRTILPGRWPYLALWLSLVISAAALAWDARRLFV
jgi:hypothetical protein